MKNRRIASTCVMSLALGAAAFGQGGGAGTARIPGAPPVVAPPESIFERMRGDRKAARGFYRKYVDIAGMAVMASEGVADLALQRTWWIVSHVLAGRPDILQAMVKNGTRLIIIGKDQVYTDMPEYRNSPNPDYLNERVRGTGGFSLTSFGEENLLSLPLDRYDDESIAVHEFCHTVDAALRAIDPGWSERRNAQYQRARELPCYRDTYAASNAGEYWAEIAQAYFDCNRVDNWNHGPVGTRERLKELDPGGYELARSTFNLGPGQDWRYTWLQKLPNVTAPPAKLGIDPYYAKFTWAREFTVVGRQAADAALLEANRTIRNMFAYRHDILKALIAEGVRLVVLGRNERIDELPELSAIRGARDFDPSARGIDYRPHSRILAVGEEQILGDAGRGSEVIRRFARAVYRVTSTRPVDPDWEKRPRQLWQQYELRVQRMDARFDEKLRQLHRDARARGLWEGTPADADAVEYWAAGVLAYFDAAPGNAPEGVRQPAGTWERLREYDADLFALVHETMRHRRGAR